MLEVQADLWDEVADAKCITTNGFVKANGELVMGAGVAGQAQARYPLFPKVAGQAVKENGNIVMPFRRDEITGKLYQWNDSMIKGKEPDNNEWFITFPVKHVWYDDADLELIERSAHQLMELVDHGAFQPIWKKVLLPRPGCGNGRLKWEDVKPVIEPILDDRIVVISK